MENGADLFREGTVFKLVVQKKKKKDRVRESLNWDRHLRVRTHHEFTPEKKIHRWMSNWRPPILLSLCRKHCPEPKTPWASISLPAPSEPDRGFQNFRIAGLYLTLELRNVQKRVGCLADEISVHPQWWLGEPMDEWGKWRPVKIDMSAMCRLLNHFPASGFNITKGSVVGPNASLTVLINIKVIKLTRLRSPCRRKISWIILFKERLVRSKARFEGARGGRPKEILTWWSTHSWWM